MSPRYGDKLGPEDRETLAKLKRKAKRSLNVGRSARPHRLAKAEEILTEIGRLEEGLSSTEARRRARKHVDKMRKRYERFDEYFNAIAPVLDSPDSGPLFDEIWTNAILRLPQVAYIKRVLARRVDSGLGCKGNLDFAAATFLWMALGGDAANVSKTRKSFSGNPFRMWAIHNPGEGADYKGLLKSLRAILERSPLELVQETMVDLARQLAESVAAEGEFSLDDLLAILKVDGTLIEADLPQEGPVSDAHAAQIRGRRRRNTGFIVYSASDRSYQQDRAYQERQRQEQQAANEAAPRSKSKPTKQAKGIKVTCHGWKLMTLSILRLNVPVIAGLYPSDVDEREATLDLIARLFDLWPDAHVHALCGDSNFDAKEFCEQLVFYWGIQPVFPQAGKYASTEPYTNPEHEDRELRGINGVPMCTHGLMEFWKKADFYDADKRRRHNIPRGEEAPNRSARIRWRCHKGLCNEKTTRPKDNARLYTLYPKLTLGELEKAEKQRAALGGEEPAKAPRPRHDKLAVERIAMLSYRNTIESLFSMLKGKQKGAKAPLRAPWAGDNEMEWLLMMAMLRITARRIVWEDGTYHLALAEADSLDLLRIPTRDRPAAGPTAEELADAMAKRLVFPAPPRTWHRIDLVQEDTHADSLAEDEDDVAA